jgi:hypothetical protein
MNGALGGGGGIASDVTALGSSERKYVIKRRDEVERRLIAYIEEGWRDGTVRTVDSKLAVYAMMGAVNTIQSWFTPKGRVSIEGIATAIVDIIVHGIDTAADAAYSDVPVPDYIVGPQPVGRSELPRAKAAPRRKIPAKRTSETDAESERV